MALWQSIKLWTHLLLAHLNGVPIGHPECPAQSEIFSAHKPLGQWKGFSFSQPWYDGHFDLQIPSSHLCYSLGQLSSDESSTHLY